MYDERLQGNPTHERLPYVTSADVCLKTRQIDPAAGIKKRKKAFESICAPVSKAAV